MVMATHSAKPISQYKLLRIVKPRKTIASGTCGNRHGMKSFQPSRTGLM